MRFVSSFFEGLFNVSLKDRVIWAVKVVAILAVLTILTQCFLSRFKIVIDPQKTSCLNATLLIIDCKDKTPRKNEVFAYVSSRAMEPIYQNGTLMAKFIRATAGDTVEVTPEYSIVVNGEKLAQGMPHLRGIPEKTIQEKFVGKRVLKNDEFWMMGTSFNSFDSRYWGAISRDHIVGRAYVVF